MLIKEYRIPLPLSTEEYKVAQLYMIAVSFNLIWFLFIAIIHQSIVAYNVLINCFCVLFCLLFYSIIDDLLLSLISC